MIGAIIQARMGSTRLPEKVLMEICGKSLLWHIITRLRQSRYIDKIVVATTLNSCDDSLVVWAKKNSIDVFRGNEDNVLGRFYECAKTYSFDNIVRVTADDPFKDPEVIDKVIETHLMNKVDFSCNNNPPTYPEGLDVEVFTFEALQKAHIACSDKFEQEHVTQYFYRNPKNFTQQCISYDEDMSDLRFTVDTKEDFEFIKTIYERLYYQKNVFLLRDILSVLKQEPELLDINSNVKRSHMYKQQ